MVLKMKGVASKAAIGSRAGDKIKSPADECGAFYLHYYSEKLFYFSFLVDLEFEVFTRFDERCVFCLYISSHFCAVDQSLPSFTSTEALPAVISPSAFSACIRASALLSPSTFTVNLPVSVLLAVLV